MSKRPLHTSELTLVQFEHERRKRVPAPWHVARRSLNTGAIVATACQCEKSLAKSQFAFSLWIYENADICARCRTVFDDDKANLVIDGFI